MTITTDMTRTAETITVGDVVRDDQSWDWIIVAQVNPVSDRNQNGLLMAEPHITFGGRREKGGDTVIRSWPAGAGIITRSAATTVAERSDRRLCAYPNDREGEHDHSECLDGLAEIATSAIRDYLDAGGRLDDLTTALATDQETAAAGADALDA